MTQQPTEERTATGGARPGQRSCDGRAPILSTYQLTKQFGGLRGESGDRRKSDDVEKCVDWFHDGKSRKDTARRNKPHVLHSCLGGSNFTPYLRPAPASLSLITFESSP